MGEVVFSPHIEDFDKAVGETGLACDFLQFGIDVGGDAKACGANALGRDFEVDQPAGEERQFACDEGCDIAGELAVCLLFCLEQDELVLDRDIEVGQDADRLGIVVTGDEDTPDPRDGERVTKLGVVVEGVVGCDLLDEIGKAQMGTGITGDRIVVNCPQGVLEQFLVEIAAA